MRFNDLMQTVLAAEERSGPGAVTLWRQCVDLLAQNDRPGQPAMPANERDALLDRLDSLRSKVTETQRISTVVELGTRLRSPSLIRFFADDRPSICAAAMARARLPDDIWPDLLSTLGPTARGILRNRRDLGPETVRALKAFGQADLLLTSEGVEESVPVTPTEVKPDISLVSPAAPPVEDESQIRRLVDRIEEYTSTSRQKAGEAAPAALRPAEAAPLRRFSFETDLNGAITWVDEGPRAALIGLSIADPALPGGSGPDAHVSGAFSRRSGFQHGRFTIVDGVLAGEWRLSAVPFFDSQTGRFQGFRGQARRPHLHEVPATSDGDKLALGGLSADSVRQLVHELRTPLNAILGFAEIIEQQLFGPAGRQYRDMASQIMGDARRLLSAFDDLDLAARVSRGEDVVEPRPVDAALLIARIATRFRVDRGKETRPITISVAEGLPQARLDPIQAERMVQHLLRTLISVAPEGEPITGSCWFQPDSGSGRVILAMDRPSTLAGMDEVQLLDPGYGPDGDWPDGPLLGLGFSLRLIRSLAASSAGSLDIDGGRFLLAMPAVAVAPEDGPDIS
ncbi:sensor histidine kinase [Sphingobium phenoxybenzoativorans]|uniref:sensor histidine kinase n=1 Tax=Sphingobium phenoxybenzoativorans TaxID=1592790 RepID=UPI000872ED92|nr:HAMP domain-containing sensor histidine kinase [Sphingobium phenoxybenzoativorans]